MSSGILYIISWKAFKNCLTELRGIAHIQKHKIIVNRVRLPQLKPLGIKGILEKTGRVRESKTV